MIFKVINPVPENPLYKVEIKRNDNFEIIKSFTLDSSKNDDAFTIFLIFKIGKNSIIEVDNKQYGVKRWDVSDSYKDIKIYV